MGHGLLDFSIDHNWMRENAEIEVQDIYDDGENDLRVTWVTLNDPDKDVMFTLWDYLESLGYNVGQANDALWSYTLEIAGVVDWVDIHTRGHAQDQQVADIKADLNDFINQTES